MMHWAPIVIVVATLASCSDGQTLTFQANHLDVFSPPTSDNVTCPLGNCVPFTHCEDSLSSNNEGIVELKISDLGKCSDSLYVCCEEVNPAATPPPLPPPNQKGCGIRNNQGIGFAVLGDSEGGETNFGEFPWMVLLLHKSNNDFNCGGSLIHHQVVLTALHCLIKESVDSLIVRAGEWDTQSPSETITHQERSVRRFIRHEEYRQGNAQNNIALVILESPFSHECHIDVVCLPEQAQHFAKSRCVATGWGKENFSPRSYFLNILKSIELPIMPSSDCETAFKGTRLGRRFKLHPSYICAGGEQGRDTCKGDGGGPLVCPVTRDGQERYVQAGITAWGIGCGEHGVPGAYTSVARFRSWIDNKMTAEGFNTNSYSIPSN